MNKIMTILAVGACVFLVGMAVYIIIKNRKNGKGCGDCSSCPHAAQCSGKNERKK